MMISDLMPHLASVADDICLLRAVHTDNEAHAPATLQLHTGVVDRCAAVDGLVVQLRAGDRKREPAELHHDPPR